MDSMTNEGKQMTDWVADIQGILRKINAPKI
jgi:hypothetical protein